MKPLVALVVLVALALVGSRQTFLTRRFPFGVQVTFTGSEFVIIGLLLGGDFLNLIDNHAIDRLRPFLCFTLGWIGFLFGLQFDRRTLRHLPRGLLGISATQALVTMAAIVPVVWLVLGKQSELSHGVLLLATATLAASAACTGQSSLALVHTHRCGSRSRHLMTLLRFISSLDPVAGVISFGVALSLLAAHPWGTTGFTMNLQWLVISVCLGCLTAWIFVSLTVTRTTESELGLYLLGAVALSSGIALYLQLSTLFVNFLCGLVVASLAHKGSIRGRVLKSMVRGERFLYILLLVLAGACWQLPSLWVVGAAAAYVGARMTGKVVGAYLATRGFARQHPVPAGVGLGLVSQAGMGLAIIIDFQLVVGGVAADVVVSVAILAIIINELMAPWLAMLVISRTAEGAT